jgi:hypothetical protein
MTSMHAHNRFYPADQIDPTRALAKLRMAPGALVTADGKPGGDLVSWPAAAIAMGYVAGDAIAHVDDHVDAFHEYGHKLVDPNADLAGALAAALVSGLAAVRVDVDGDGLGDHTTLGVERAGDGFLCWCSAIGASFVLDENLECGDRSVRWGAKGAGPGYRVVGIRPLFIP